MPKQNISLYSPTDYTYIYVMYTNCLYFYLSFAQLQLALTRVSKSIDGFLLQSISFDCFTSYPNDKQTLTLNGYSCLLSRYVQILCSFSKRKKRNNVYTYVVMFVLYVIKSSSLLHRLIKWSVRIKYAFIRFLPSNVIDIFHGYR